MAITMIGIDHDRASVDIRAMFSFTKKNAGEAMIKMKENAGVYGCIILSTCNRLEIWTSHEDDQDPELYSNLCRLKDIENGEVYREYFTERKNEEACEHLFCLAGGLKSQILGEDQILTQIKDALNLARENFATDGVLEVLFRMAVTAGKKIKTEAPLAHGNPSVIHLALRQLEKQGFSARDKVCLVIGNGEMGKVAAQALRDAGAHVTVTVRQYRSGIVTIPIGCSRINYGERMEFLPICDLVVSATASPNYTLREELFAGLETKENLILLDLAVPRDIDPKLKEHKNFQVYDMDSFRVEDSALADPNIKIAKAIVAQQKAEFFQWANGRDIIPRIQEIRADAVEDFNLRIEKILKNAIEDPKEREALKKAVDTAAGKVVNKLIFGLRDSLNEETFRECVAGLEKLYEE